VWGGGGVPVDELQQQDPPLGAQIWATLVLVSTEMPTQAVPRSSAEHATIGAAGVGQQRGKACGGRRQNRAQLVEQRGIVAHQASDVDEGAARVPHTSVGGQHSGQGLPCKRHDRPIG